MIYWAIILFILSLLFMLVEILLPGFGIFGGLGIILFALAMYFISSVFFYAPLVIILSIVLFLAIIIFFICFFAKAKLYKKIILEENLNEDKNDFDLSLLLDTVGITRTTLKPFGMVKFNDVTIEVCAQGEYIEPNTSVIATEIIDNRLYVEKLNK